MSDLAKENILVVLLIGVIILGVLNFNMSNQIDRLKEQVDSILRTQWDDLGDSRDGHQEIIAKIDSINEQAIEAAKLTYDEEVTVNGYNEADATVNATISFGLRQFNEADIVTVTARGTVNNAPIEAVAQSVGAGLYNAAITLPAQDNYTLNYSVTGVSNVSGELTAYYLADQLCERFHYELNTMQSFGRSPDEYTVSLSPVFENDTQGHAALDVKELSFIVESGEEMIGTWDLLATPAQTVEFLLPEGDASARLVIVDAMGIRYVQTNDLYLSHAPNQGGAYEIDSAPAPRAIGGDNGHGYIYIAPENNE